MRRRPCQVTGLYDFFPVVRAYNSGQGVLASGVRLVGSGAGLLGGRLGFIAGPGDTARANGLVAEARKTLDALDKTLAEARK